MSSVYGRDVCAMAAELPLGTLSLGLGTFALPTQPLSWPLSPNRKVLGTAGGVRRR